MLDKVTQLLLVEDDEDDYILTCDYLEQLDSHTFNIQWISSPEQAIETLSKNEHDICLLDYRLGASNGLDVLKEAIANGFSGPIIMLTGQSNDELDSAALDAGAVDYLIKTDPFWFSAFALCKMPLTINFPSFSFMDSLICDGFISNGM